MIKVCKIRFYPNSSQIKTINKILGACNYVRNLYQEYNIRYHNEDKKFLSGYEFSKIINKLKKTSENYSWLNEISSKALKDAIMNKESSFKRFFKKKSKFPKFQSRKRFTCESFFFIKDSIKFDDKFGNSMIKIPILGKVRITEKNYLPDIASISSGRVIKERNKYYISFIYTKEKEHVKSRNIRFGIDVGVKNYATVAYDDDKIIIEHFKDYESYKNITKKIENLQKCISHKAETNYGKLLNTYLDKHSGQEPNETTKNIMKGESYNTSQIRCLKRKIQRLYRKLSNIRKNFINQLVCRLVVRAKPLSITIEDLSISNLLSSDSKSFNSNLRRYIGLSGFKYFRTCLENKCREYSIELRIADKYFASSKTCHECGHKMKSLKLSDRIFHCTHCGTEVDRDVNAAMNLLDTNKYTVIV